MGKSLQRIYCMFVGLFPEQADSSKTSVTSKFYLEGLIVIIVSILITAAVHLLVLITQTALRAFPPPAVLVHTFIM